MTEREQSKSLEQQPNPQFDAIFVHGYWMSEHKTGLGLRSRLAIRAAALAYDEGKGAGKIIMDLGHVWGPDNPAEGNLMARELMEKYHIPRNAIIFREDAYSTGGEVKTAIELARQNGWTKILDIAFSEHQKSIPKVYKEYHGEDLLTTRSIERIIEEKDDHLANHLVKRLGKSRYGRVYKYIYEPVKRRRMRKKGFTYEALEQENRNARKQKGPDSPLSRRFGRSLDIDVYKL
jgi:hypothetical protein